MKKIKNIIYFLIMALMIFSLSGCDTDIFGHGGSKKKSTNTAHSAMSISTTALERGKSYQIYKDAIPYDTNRQRSFMYYVADVQENPDKRVVMNLEFEEPFSNDAFVIVDVSDSSVVFGYNPSASGDSVASNDNIIYTNYNGRDMRKLYYTSLDLSEALSKKINSSSIPTVSDDEEIITINLKPDGSATLSGAEEGRVHQYDYVWHVAPDHAGEYWTDDAGEIYDSESDLEIKDGIYIAHDIRYVPNTLPFSESQVLPKEKNSSGMSEDMYVAYYNEDDDEDNTYIDNYHYVLAALPKDERFKSLEEVKAAMTHSASEAYNNPVLHIAKEGMYRLKGLWTGQIMVDIPNNTVNTRKKTREDPDAKVTLILDNVTVKCTVAPALVFNKVYECGPTDSEGVELVGSSDISAKLLDDVGIYAGAIIALADGSVNSFIGSNVARLNNPNLNSKYTSSDIGSYVNAQDKMYKFDGAFHSRVSMAIGIDEYATNGTLNITGTYEGLDSEMHMLIDSGTIKVTAEDDGINVNEDETSVFTMDNGMLTVISKYGDGIDSNGYIIFHDAQYLNIVAAQDNDPLDAQLGIEMPDSVKAIYKHSDYSEQEDYDTDPDEDIDPEPESSDTEPEYKTVTTVMEPKTLANDKGVIVLDLFFDDTSGKKIESDDEGTRIDAATGESSVFYIEHRVNNFSGIYDSLTRSDNDDK